ncbi:MAG TPA: aldehyde dehydrogenase family protein [Trebonia sp.]|nr:aldehyde dehydrogenase family protein [Trebonia sp.]
MVPESIRHFIGGQQVRSSFGKAFPAVDPATGKEYARVEVGVGADINQAVLAAQNLFGPGPWADMTALERAAVLARIADGIDSRAGQIADFEALGSGLPITQASHHVAAAAQCFRLAAGLIRERHGETSVSPGRPGYLALRPAGVTGVVTSWRTPFLAQARALAPALAAGGTVVLQADIWAPLSAALLPEIVTDAGLPAGVLNIVHGTGSWRGTRPTTGARDALVTHAGVPLLSFAGDAAAGEEVAREAAERGKRLTTNLASHSPCVILADADIERAADSALFGAFALNGGRRTATARILAERSVYEAVVTRVADGAGRLRVGAPSDPATEIGALVHAEHYDQVMSGVRRGIRDGARLAAGGRRPGDLTEGSYLSPTVLADVTPDMRIFTEVMSAPVACVTPFDSEEQAVTLARALTGAPAAYLWTADQRRANRLAMAIGSPMTWVNAHNPDDLRTPPGHAEIADDLDFYTGSGAIYVAADDDPAPRLSTGTGLPG